MKNAEEYQGSAHQYIREVIVPELPSIRMILEYHNQIKKYLLDKDNIRFVRVDSPFRGILSEDHGKQFYGGDNELPLWIYMKCLQMEAPNIEHWMKGQIPPIAWKRVEGATYKTVGRKKDARGFAEKGWKHSHLLQVRPKVNVSLDARMARYIHPLNHCPSPSPKRWSFSPSFFRNDVGEDPRFIHLVWHELYSKHQEYPGFKSMFSEFLLMAEASVDLSSPPDDFPLTIFPKDNTGKATKTSTPKPKTKPSALPSTNVQIKGIAVVSHTGKVDRMIKGFKIQKSWIGEGYIIHATFSRGKMHGRSVVYNHDEIYEYAKVHLNGLDSFHDTGVNSNSSNVPGYARPYVQYLD